MKKKILIGITIVIVVLIAVFFVYVKWSSSRSPKETVELSIGSANVKVVYCRPYKKGREIFGALVPYGQTWRTGANEATTLETTGDLLFGNQELKAGTYSIWTVPGAQSWEVVINSEIPSWGIKFSGETQRNPATDVVKTIVPVTSTANEMEQFTIQLVPSDSTASLTLAWDKTLVSVPFTVK